MVPLGWIDTTLLISVKQSPAWSESAQVRNILRLLGLVRLKGNDE